MDIIVKGSSLLTNKNQRFDCAIGRHGFIAPEYKTEGDGKTPTGTYRLRACYYRPDRLAQPQTSLPLVALNQEMGWCDDPNHARYNQLVRLPFSASHETLWREDSAYNLIITIGYNDDQIITGKGSAIFIHCLHEDRRSTEGCIALDQIDLLMLISDLTPDSRLTIEA